MNDEVIVKFYKTRKPYGFMSNFYRRSVELKGVTWPTSEHYFQAQKFAGTSLEEKVRESKTPKDAAAIGRDRSNPLCNNWENVKDDVMLDVVRAKFTQHEDLKHMLLDTADAHLIEDSPTDDYWGQIDGVGKNMLGEILMKVREELRNVS